MTYMKKILYSVPTLLMLAAIAVPMKGSHTRSHMADEPDTIDAAVVDTTIDNDGYTEDADWAGGDDDAADSVAVEEVTDVFCPYDDMLMTECANKTADYNLQNGDDANAGVSFSASLFVPDADSKGEVKKGSGYSQMVSRILTGTMDSADVAKWEINSLAKMLEKKWDAVKRGYTADQVDIKKMCEQDGTPYSPMSYSYRTTVTPVWKFADKGVTTFSIEDEVYTGGAHGMVYHYYLSLDANTDRLMGLTDIFKPECLSKVFDLVSQKLKEGPQAAHDEDTWPSVAEVTPAPSATDYSVRTGQMEEYEGKWYPRPALTECGVVFTYPPYVKNCYAAGTINIVLTTAEIEEYIK